MSDDEVYGIKRESNSVLEATAAKSPIEGVSQSGTNAPKTLSALEIAEILELQQRARADALAAAAAEGANTGVSNSPTVQTVPSRSPSPARPRGYLQARVKDPELQLMSRRRRQRRRQPQRAFLPKRLTSHGLFRIRLPGWWEKGMFRVRTAPRRGGGDRFSGRGRRIRRRNSTPIASGTGNGHDHSAVVTGEVPTISRLRRRAFCVRRDPQLAALALGSVRSTPQPHYTIIAGTEASRGRSDRVSRPHPSTDSHPDGLQIGRLAAADSEVAAAGESNAGSGCAAASWRWRDDLIQEGVRKHFRGIGRGKQNTAGLQQGQR